MAAQALTLELLRRAGIVGIITAIALSLSDISLLYSPAGGYESDGAIGGRGRAGAVGRRRSDRFASSWAVRRRLSRPAPR